MASNKQESIQREDNLSSNGWTQYQKLVLAELERHDESLTRISEEVISLRLNLALIGAEISEHSEQSQKGIETLRLAISKDAESLKEARAEFSKAKEELTTQKVSISKINVKIGAAIAAVSMIGSAAISALFKFLLQ